MTKHYILLYLHTIAIDQVTGVNLMCEPVELINQCTVMWNVSSFLVYVTRFANTRHNGAFFEIHIFTPWCSMYYKLCSVVI